MGLWIPIILLCANPSYSSCKVITGLELITTKEQCFKESIKKAKKAVEYPEVFQALPLCQQIPSVVLPEETEKVDL
tara:strand:+ start:333 stop:560 length:228 start_codon:yes stop_codon:yes gene_type:complete